MKRDGSASLLDLLGDWEHPSTVVKRSGFQMQSFGHKGIWEPMEDGAAATVWKPRDTAREAVTKCATWTGLVFIPAMRVVDLATGEVVWAETERYPNGGPSVRPEWTDSVYAAVHDDLGFLDEVIDAATGGEL